MRTDEQVNALARSWGAEPQPSTPIKEGGLPCLTVAGVTAFVYRKNGRVIVSIDTDEIDDDTPVYNFGGDDLVAITVKCNGGTVWEGDPTEDDLRAIRKAGG